MTELLKANLENITINVDTELVFEGSDLSGLDGKSLKNTSKMSHYLIEKDFDNGVKINIDFGEVEGWPTTQTNPSVGIDIPVGTFSFLPIDYKVTLVQTNETHGLIWRQFRGGFAGGLNGQGGSVGKADGPGSDKSGLGFLPRDVNVNGAVGIHIRHGIDNGQTTSDETLNHEFRLRDNFKLFVTTKLPIKGKSSSIFQASGFKTSVNYNGIISLNVGITKKQAESGGDGSTGVVSLKYDTNFYTRNVSFAYDYYKSKGVGVPTKEHTERHYFSVVTDLPKLRWIGEAKMHLTHEDVDGSYSGGELQAMRHVKTNRLGLFKTMRGFCGGFEYLERDSDAPSGTSAQNHADTRGFHWRGSIKYEFDLI